MIGQVIGTYKILEKIGEGGMGVVYKGMDLGLERAVAIKVLTPDFAHNPELIARFRAEAKAQANLNHTNITTLYAFLQLDGQCLIVMEYIEGETFEDLLVRGGKLPWQDAIALTRQALYGLGFAHRMNIIQRDIKPSNLMLTKTKVCKIMAFGIAKAWGGSAKTRTGLQMGTPQYMSPEQIRGRQVDARSDLYSLGITLYQLLSGDLPFQADSDYELMSAHINTPPPVLTDIHTDVPQGVEQCVHKALAKEPEGRFQNADEFGSALDRASRSPKDLLDTQIEVLPQPGYQTDKNLPRKTVIETTTPYRPKTVIETQVPRVPTPAPAVTPAPAPRKKSAMVPILVAALVGAAIAGGALWKYLQPSPQPNPNVVVTPKNGGPSSGGPGTQNGGVGGLGQGNQKQPGTTQPPFQYKTPPIVTRPTGKPTVVNPPVNQERANLVVLCNLDCSWTLDGQPQGLLAAGRPTRVPVSLGAHMITAATADGSDTADVTVNALASTQTVPARMDLLTKRNQRLQGEAVQRQRDAQAEAMRQRQEAITQQQQQQQAARDAQAEIVRQRQQAAQMAQAGTPAITSPCQVPALRAVWRNVANNGRYRFRIDCEHADIYEATTNRIVADLVAKKGKYVGTTLLSPCGGGRGKIELLSLSEGRIEARVEVPNSANHLCTNGMILAFTSWVPASFIPE